MGRSHWSCLHAHGRTGQKRAHLSMPEVEALEPHNAAGLCCREEMELCWESGLIPEALPPHLCIIVCCEVDPPREACTCSRHSLATLDQDSQHLLLAGLPLSWEGQTIFLPVNRERGLSPKDLTQVLPENERLCMWAYFMTSMCTCSTPAPSRAGAMPA